IRGSTGCWRGLCRGGTRGRRRPADPPAASAAAWPVADKDFCVTCTESRGPRLGSQGRGSRRRATAPKSRAGSAPRENGHRTPWSFAYRSVAAERGPYRETEAGDTRPKQARLRIVFRVRIRIGLRLVFRLLIILGF